MSIRPQKHKINPDDPYSVDQNRLSELKKFRLSGKGPWEEVPDENWNDWVWQMKNRLTKMGDLQEWMSMLTEDEREGVNLSGNRLAMAITPYFFNLINPEDESCPIRKQVIPRSRELEVKDWEMGDPCGEDSHSPVPGLVHRYPDRVLFLVTDRCAAYCRYCTRSRLVSNASGYDFHPNFSQQIDYIKKHPEIRDVLLSGGDPLLLSDAKLDAILTELRKIKHIEFVRIGSRIPLFLPQRITPALCKILQKHHPLYISIHANHPAELTSEVQEGLSKLADSGVPLGNQSVLLKGVNDDITTLKALLHKLIMCRVRPYYLYQCDLIKGSSHLRVSVRKGIELMNKIRGHTTGYAVPQYVIDAPGGGGKIPINPEYILSHSKDRIVVRNFEGKVFEYPEVDDKEIVSSEKVQSNMEIPKLG